MPERVLRANGLTVRISPVTRTSARLLAEPARVLDARTVRAALDGARSRILAMDVDDDGDRDGPETFAATIYDYDQRRTLVATGPVDDPGAAEVTTTAAQPQPDPEEFDEAVTLLRADDEVGAALSSGDLVAYPAMPPLANVTRPDGTVERAVTVGLHTTGDGPVAHRFAAVNLVTGAVLHDPAAAPRAATADCGVPSRDGCPVTPRSGPVRVQVERDDERLWDVIVRRPRISSGVNGSGVELRDVRYRGRRVLRRAHMPILNVRYDRSVPLHGCGPTYRDWLNEEACFVANGRDALPGYRVCPTPPKTIFEAGHDRGNFRGVTFHIEGTQVVMLSETSAGWYRYVSEWRLGANGSIRPVFGFDAVRNVCTCKPHTHHAYWRFDWNLGGRPATVEEFNDPPLPGMPGHWHTIRREMRRRRDPDRRRRWRITTAEGRGYMIAPGDNDGIADWFGAGDLWVLRRRAGQIDDGFPTSARADIERFVNAGDVTDADLVLWYAGHFTHAPGEERDHHVGPVLRPVDG